MSLLHNSNQKIKNIQRTIDGLLDGDFPLESCRSALRKLQLTFEGLQTKLEKAVTLHDEAIISELTNNVNVKIYQVLPILGFILRSTNVRNAFELLEPLHRLAEAFLQGRPQLILSSEWDYVPFAYPQSLDDLRSYILIGLPASEAASALLMPLAAHELGHAVWRNLGIGAGMQVRLQAHCEEQYVANNARFRQIFRDYNERDILSASVLPLSIEESAKYAARHAEEIFCDLFGYAIFGLSYLRAFAYILAPSAGVRDPKYPTNATRISIIYEIGEGEGALFPNLESLGFAHAPPTRRGDERLRFIVQMAENSVSKIKGEIWSIILNLVAKAKVQRPSDSNARHHVREIAIPIPSPTPSCLGDIINAGWMRFDELVEATKDPNELWQKLDNLNEILLKTIEVYEFRARVAQ
jgi:hypothetical protein